ncbi:MAG: hypothetical protein M3R53_00815 [Candidatus Eremiobacteraeota bacterium]|nr:hypothetical protein [Candidatus Eremiobacteraeota bacterium]
MHLLSRALPQTEAPWILSDHRLIGWNPDAPVELDVETFESFARDPASRARALDTYGGDLLQEVDAEWLESRRREYRELFCMTALESAQEALEAGDYAAAAALAQRVVELDPWREDAIRTAIAARARGGDRARALVAYLDFERRVRDELGTEPMPETQALYETIVKGAESYVRSSASRSRSTLPKNMARFIGREREVATVAAAIERCRLVTLTGAGGVGKSRLAIRVAEAVCDRFAGEPLFVELATIANDRGSFEGRILDAFGIAATNENVVDVLSRVLGTRRCLIVLDNVEHLVDVAGRFLRELLARCGSVTVLVTSRQPLHLQGEQVVALRPLDLPAPEAASDVSMMSEAAMLFVDRATSVNSEVAFSTADAESIVAICRRLDGIPLAIELAAARSNVLTPAQIDARLSDRFDLLKTRNVDALLHHQTLRATLDWSFDLLEERERRAFRRLAVFKSGWTLESATEVIGLDGAEDIDSLESLSRLIDQSLVTAYQVGADRRYDFLETVRVYALLRLAESQETAPSRAAYSRYFARYVDEKSRLFASPRERSAFDAIAVEHDNILAVIDDAIARSDADLAARLSCDLSSFWVLRGFVLEGRRRVEAVLRLETELDALLRRQLCNVASNLHFRLGETTQSMKRASESLGSAPATRDDRVVAEALVGQARCWYVSDELSLAAGALQRARAIFEEHDDQLGIARTLDFLGIIADLEGDALGATALYRQSLSTYEERGDFQSVATVNNHLAFQAYERGEHASSIAFSTRAIEIWHDYGNLQGENWARYNIACAQAALGLTKDATLGHLACIVTAHRHGFVRDVCNGLERLAGLTISYAPALSARCMGYAAHLRERYGHAVLANEREGYGEAVARVESLLGESKFRTAWQAGVSSDQEALIDALSAEVRNHSFL